MLNLEVIPRLKKVLGVADGGGQLKVSELLRWVEQQVVKLHSESGELRKINGDL